MKSNSSLTAISSTSLKIFKMKLIIFPSLAVLSLTAVISISTAAPNSIEACETLLPPHNGSTPQNGSSFFSFTYTNEGNGTYLILINGGQFFQWWKGFFIQARPADNPWTYQTFGSFESVSEVSVPFTCLTENDMIRHSYNQWMTEVYVRWTPPSTGNVSVRFRATLVQDYEEIIEGLLSAPLKIN